MPKSNHHRWSGALTTGAPSLALVALLVGVAPFAQGAALYRWIDADGSVQFSDSLPLEMPPAGFEGAPPPTIGEVETERARQERLARIEARRLALEAEERERSRAELLEAAAAEMNRKTIISPYSCKEARQTLAAQREPRRTYYTLGEDGKFRPSSAEDAERNIAEWEHAVEQLCADNVRIVAPGSEEAEKALADNARWGNAEGETGQTPVNSQ